MATHGQTAVLCERIEHQRNSFEGQKRGQLTSNQEPNNDSNL